MKKAIRPAIFKWRQTEPELLLCAVRWYLRYSLSFRDVEELLSERGLKADHTTIWGWGGLRVAASPSLRFVSIGAPSAYGASARGLHPESPTALQPLCKMKPQTRSLARQRWVATSGLSASSAVPSAPMGAADATRPPARSANGTSRGLFSRHLPPRIRDSSVARCCRMTPRTLSAAWTPVVPRCRGRGDSRCRARLER